MAVDGAGLVLTVALGAHPLAARVTSTGAAAAALLQVALAPHAHNAPPARSVAAWSEEQRRRQAFVADFLASCQSRRFVQVRITMALAGALCGAVTARGGLHGLHAAYNALATMCMFATACSPDPLLLAMYRGWPSLWAAVCVAMLPFHAASEQCARGYDTSRTQACIRLAEGRLDGTNLLPFIVHVAVGPALRLPGGVCYLFLLLPVAGFGLMELPHLRAFALVERLEIGVGLLVSAALAAHGVLCCDAAERDAHEQRVQLAAEKQHTKNFMRYILHEVRVPFNVLRLGIDHLAECMAQPAVATALPAASAAEFGESLTAMATSADSMSRIINDVLDLAKIEEGKLQLREEPFNAATTLAELAVSWSRPAAEADVRFTVALEPAAAELFAARALVGDALRLQQILNNLCSNALKFTPRGGVIEVRARVRQHAASELAAEAEAEVVGAPGKARKERVWLILDVQDSGCGIAAEELPHLFRPYSQLLSGLRRGTGGTGLGLNLSRTLSTRCGGSLACSSTPGAGSTFTARIPYALGGAPPQPAPAAPLVVLPPLDKAAAAAAAAASPGSRASLAGAPVHRVLVVDDSPLSRTVLVRLLGAMGVAADAAKDGQAGVSAVLAANAAKAPYSIVFMDKEMPGMDGEEATRTLRAGGIDVPIIALTGNALSDDRDSFFAAGCTAFLTKPATRDQVAAVLLAHGGVKMRTSGDAT